VGLTVNLIDSPGHVDFNSEVSSALRLADGALLVVDAVDGVSAQTETVLRQALAERVQPVLVINKIDRYFLELHLTADEMHSRFAALVASVNTIIEDFDTSFCVNPKDGNVAFVSAKQGWGFSLDTFARVHAAKRGAGRDTDAALIAKLRRRLWESSGAFAEGIIAPLQGFFELADQLARDPSSMDATIERALERLTQLGSRRVVSTTALRKRLDAQPQGKEAKELLRFSLHSWLPAADVLLDMMYAHIPSPDKAQRHRVPVLYSGPVDDECGQAICDANPDGPLMFFASKLVQEPTARGGAATSNKFIAFGRVYAGTVRPGDRVRVLTPEYVAPVEGAAASSSSANSKNAYMARVQSVVCFQGAKRGDPVSIAYPGDIVGLIGVDAHLNKSGTVTTSDVAHSMRVLRLTVAPVVRVAIEAVRPSELPKLVDAMRRLAKADPLLRCPPPQENNGQNLICAAGELHLEVSLKKLETFSAGIQVRVGRPTVEYCETVLGDSEPVWAKSSNKHNRLSITAHPLPASFVQAVADEDIVWPPRGEGSAVAFARKLVTEHSIDANMARRVMYVTTPADMGERGLGCMLVDGTTSVQNLGAIRDSITAALQWVCREGPLCNEQQRGVMYVIRDAKIHGDAAHRGTSEILPCARRGFYAAFLSALPALLEPVFEAEIQAPDDCLGKIFSTLNTRRGRIVSHEPQRVLASLPVAESFGFVGDLRGVTSGRAFVNLRFDHW
jgi:elongation factor 2